MRLTATTTYNPQLFFFATSTGTKKKSDRALGEEKDFINKQEKDLLKNLMKKVKDQAEKVEMTAEQKKTADLKEIEKLCDKFGVRYSDSLGNDIYDWKHKD